MAVLTLGLKNLQRQLDTTFPDRHRPDGWLGDAAHKMRTSGHNEDDTKGSKPAWDGDPDNLPEVRALDVAADLGDGVDSQEVVDHIRALPGLATVVRYLIHHGRIYHARTGFAAEDYDGSNPHDHHIHVEGAWTQAADNNTTFDYRLQEVPVAFTPADKTWLTAQLKANSGNDGSRLFDLGKQSDGTPTSVAGNALWAQGIPNGTKADKSRDLAWEVMRDLGSAAVALRTEVVSLRKEVAELKALIAPQA